MNTFHNTHEHLLEIGTGLHDVCVQLEGGGLGEQTLGLQLAHDVGTLHLPVGADHHLELLHHVQVHLAASRPLVHVQM